MKKLFALFIGVSIALSSIAQGNKRQIQLDDIWKKGTFSPQYVWGLRSMNDGAHYTMFEQNEKQLDINQYEYKSGEKIRTIFTTASIDEKLQIEEYQFSADEQKILLSTDVEPIYRHSTREHNFVFSIKEKKLTSISKSGKQRYATFSPAGDLVAYVRENNLFYINLKDLSETQITKDGQYNHVINGATDWVYEEEFAFDKAFFWSPDGEKIAFYKFDESQVKEFNMPMYGGHLYPKDYKFKYPKAGEDNSKVTIHIFDLKSGNITKAKLGEYEYIPRIKWSKDANKLAVQRMNRHQNQLDILLVDANTGKTENIYNEKSKTYIDIKDDWTFLADLNTFIISSEKDGFNQLYSINFKDKKEVKITNGKFDVTTFYGVDKNGYLYYQAAEKSPTQREVYRIKKDGSSKKMLTERQGWNDAEFSKGMRFFINTWSNANTPYVFTVQDSKGKLKHTISSNTQLKKKLEEYDLAKKEFFSFKTSYGDKLNAWIMKPSNMDPNKNYPVLVTIYGGPGSQTVKDEWAGSNFIWHQMLTQKGYVVVSVDNRGTGARGANFKKCTYKQLGRLEVEDYIETAKFLATLDFVDKSRIGMWGWSYGGYMSTLALTKGADYYKSAIAVAPVTNWRYYDNIYTERYMQTPQENAKGYDNNSPINHVKKMKGNYLLIHGTADDNVHFQNTVEIVDALMKADKQYDFYIYTDKNHSIYGGNARFHLYTKMTNFILEKL